jgi:hypothetical protein
MVTDSNNTSYSNNFDGMYSYCADWLSSRAAWISSQYVSSYTPKVALMGDINKDTCINIVDASLVQRFIADMVLADNESAFASDVNNDGKITIDDSTAIQKYIAKFATGYGITNTKHIYG